MNKPPYKVLFICLGNICRSPTAEGVFRLMVQAGGLQNHIEVDSAGTGHWHIGNPPDPRAIEAAAQRGVAIDNLQARQISKQDMEYYDYIIGMDKDNIRSLQRIAKPSQRSKIHLFLAFAPEVGEREVPDPYYGNEDGFPHALALIEQASVGLLAHIESRL